jgi:hypothetical protein
VKNLRPLLAVALLAVGAVGSARADDLDVPALLDGAKTSFAAKKYGKCLGDLQMVLGEVGRMRMEVLKGLLPGAPEGWTAGEPEGQSQAGIAWFVAGTQVKRNYTKGESNADVEIWADAGTVMASFMMLASNPAFLPQGSKIITVKGRKTIFEWRKDDKAGKLTILLNTPNAFMTVEARGVEPKELSDGFPAKFDLDAIERAIAE